MKKYLIILLLIIGISCSGDEENLEPTDINLVTGIDMKAFEESMSTRLGNPNTFNHDQFSVSPNPVKNYLRIKSVGKMTDIWILPGKSSNSYKGTDFQQLLSSDLYSENTIADKSVLKLVDLDWSEFALNIESLNPGYYKVFIKINGNIFWDNIYVTNDNFELKDLINYWK